MFKKAQIRLFLIITSILLAIFIFVLSSINIITKSVMQRQSRTVLAEIAAGIEYDDETSTFVLMHFRNDFSPKRNKMFDENQPPKPAEEHIQTTVSSELWTDTQTTTVTSTTSEAVQTETEEVTEPVEEETEEIQEQEEAVEAEEVQPENPDQNNVQADEQQQQQPQNQQEEVQTVPPQAEMQTENIDDSDDNDEDDDSDDDDKDDKDNKNDDKNKKENFPPEKNDRYRRWKEENPPFDFNFPPYYSDEPFKNDEQKFFPTDFSDTSELYGNIMLLENSVTETNPEPSKPDDNNNNNNNNNNEPDKYIQKSAKNTINGEPVPKSLGSIDFFVIMSDMDGKYASTLNNDDIDENTAQSYITAILDAKKDTGMLNSYQYYMAEKNNGTLMVFTDKSDEIKVLKQLTRTTVIIGGISLVLLSVVAYFLSKKSLEPLKDAFEKQKRFISDASHELKTPLTVISANADVLSDEIGNNKWLEYIKAQTDRMNVLVNELLNLTRLENNTAQFVKTDFNLSQAVTNTALPFECQAFESNKKFIVDIEDGLTVNGSEQHIKQLTAIFIDNALKYSNDGGLVRIKLRAQGDKKILSIYNTGQGVKDSEKEKIFERFYRSDDSRSRMTGGYGLGLAIAKSIIEKHKFKVDIENEEGKSICFLITM